MREVQNYKSHIHGGRKIVVRRKDSRRLIMLHLLRRDWRSNPYFYLRNYGTLFTFQSGPVEFFYFKKRWAKK